MKIGRFCDSFQEINIQSQDQSVINFPLIETIRSTDFTSVFNLALLIRRVIDTEACKTSEIYTIREHVSVELDELRRKYGNLPEFLVNLAILFEYLLMCNLDISCFGNSPRDQFKRS